MLRTVPLPLALGLALLCLVMLLVIEHGSAAPRHRTRFSRSLPPPLPKVPEGLEPCTEPLWPAVQHEWPVGEAIRYLVEVNGLSVGTVDFKVERRGEHEEQMVTEYRSQFLLDALIASFIPMSGKAAALVPLGGLSPSVAMNDYLSRNRHYEEMIELGADGTRLTSDRRIQGKPRVASRRFSIPVVDFLAGFYAFRRLPENSNGCAILYGRQRAYTIWLHADGSDKVETPVGLRPAWRYRVRFASERSKRLVQGTVWLGQSAARIPFRTELVGKHRLVARAHLYESGATPQRIGRGAGVAGD